MGEVSPNHDFRSHPSPFSTLDTPFQRGKCSEWAYFVAVRVALVTMLRGAVARTLWTARGAAGALTARIPAEESLGGDILRKLCGGRCWEGVRGLHVTPAASKAEGRKEMLASMPRRDEGTEGESAVSIDSSIRG